LSGISDTLLFVRRKGFPMFKFTFQSQHKIHTIKAFRVASQIPCGSNGWSLRFTKDLVENGLVTQTEGETHAFIRIIIEAKKAMKNDYMGPGVDFTWTVDEYKPVALPVLFCDRG
jgi:hypothetical protein